MSKYNLTDLLNEAWDDGIEWGDINTAVEEASNRLAEIGAEFIEFDYDLDDVNQYSAETAFESISNLMQEKYSGDDTLYYAFEDFYDGNERRKAFVFSDGDYVDTLFWDEDDIELFRGAGQLNENQQVTEDLDLEDPKMGDTFDSYTHNLMGLIDSYGYNKGNFEELSHGYGYKYGSVYSAADVYRENAINTLPKPIAEEITNIIESSWLQEKAEENAKERFFDNNPEVENEFYGFWDELDVQMLKDAGYDDLADELQSNIEEQILAILDDEYEIRNGASIQTNFNRDPNSIYVYIYTYIHEYVDGYMTVEIDLGQVYNDIDSPEALKAAMKDFYDNKVPAFKKGEKPAEITRDEQIEEAVKPLNESVEFEELIDNITTWPWHYAEIPDDMYQEMVDDLTAYGTPQDSEEVTDYLVDKLGSYLEKLDKQAGYVDSSGQYETDEGHFAIIDSNFYEALGLFYDSSQYEIYHSMGFYDMYEFTPKEYQYVIEAGQIYNESLNKQKDVLEADDVEYNPSFEQIDEMLENATEELI